MIIKRVLQPIPIENCPLPMQMQFGKTPVISARPSYESEERSDPPRPHSKSSMFLRAIGLLGLDLPILFDVKVLV